MTADITKLVTFRLGQELFAADVFAVDGVLRYVPPTSVPDVPGWLEGDNQELRLVRTPGGAHPAHGYAEPLFLFPPPPPSR